MYVVAFRRGAHIIFRNTEFKFYLWIIGIATLIISLDLFVEMEMDILTAIRYAGFHVASLSSTTGFVAVDFDTWPPLSKGFLMMMMFLGGCAGSTAGGLKVARIILLFKFVSLIIKQKIHPQLINRIKLNGQIMSIYINIPFTEQLSNKKKRKKAESERLSVDFIC